jgi:dolichol-phosphate mannosyltransferase
VSLGRVLVIVPTYNEAENLEGILVRLADSVPEADALVVDDGSPDGTGELADKLAARNPGVHVLHRTAKEGLGRAYVAGFRWAREQGYDVLVEMDADGSHAPEQLPRILAALESADLVLGSRYVPGGAVTDWPLHRLLLSRAGNRYTRWALRLPLNDATGGFRAARAELIDRLPFDDVASEGYCFQVDWAWRAVRAGARVAEVPITFTERTLGRSKMSGSIVGEALVRVTGWGLRDRLADHLPGRVRRPVPARTRLGGGEAGP